MGARAGQRAWGLDPAAVRYGPDGLVAAVVQDADDGRVLMVAWQDAEAVAATLRTGEAHFHSRSRGRLWRKGESSGNTLAVVGMELDCDADAVLIRARPAGPTCHTGARSCFDESVEGLEPSLAQDQGFAWLERLWETIEERARRRPAGSYTTRLLDGGVDAVGRKVTEEATEVLMAAKDDAAARAGGGAGDQAALAGEMADLLYHALVLCAERGLPPSAVIGALRERHRG
ncbi:MAG TPA: bifunctional phosphoribosyl-AMP cyclohydrolase/phosphoribosyl-ATP diphosphatase HisIE [Longimicrobiales bacterium]|nr:bifunctional phosphoribosyl-AMP cyclohydrolase/phosphoribosyl-ATP diphosphatase HisIE [Longimicrobiales bacterium]